MATITSPEVIGTLIANNGVYPGDERIPQGPVVRIVEYISEWGNVAWGVVYASEARRGMLYRYEAPGGHIRSPRVIFEREVPDA